MPHNFVKINAMSPNPGLRTRENVEPICKKHMGSFENLWYDDAQNPDLRLRAGRRTATSTGSSRDLHGWRSSVLFQAP